MTASMTATLTRTNHRLPCTPGHVYADGDGLWYVETTVTATGQVLRCGPYYQRPADEMLPVIAARLYGLRKW
jgi:hypothetical protein